MWCCGNMVHIKSIWEETLSRPGAAGCCCWGCPCLGTKHKYWNPHWGLMASERLLQLIQRAYAKIGHLHFGVVHTCESTYLVHGQEIDCFKSSSICDVFQCRILLDFLKVCSWFGLYAMLQAKWICRTALYFANKLVKKNNIKMVVFVSSLKLPWHCQGNSCWSTSHWNCGDSGLDKEVIHSRIIVRVSLAGSKLNSFLHASCMFLCSAYKPIHYCTI